MFFRAIVTEFIRAVSVDGKFCAKIFTKTIENGEVKYV